MLIDKNIKSFFALIKKWKANKKSLNGCPEFPHYKHKTKGRNIVIFTSNQFSLKKDGMIYFPKKSNLKPLKTNIREDIKQVRIIPQTSCYVIEVVYEVENIDLITNDNKAAIDLGVNNLATLTFNNNHKSIIINGKPLKSMNQYYNKKQAKIKSELELRHKRKSSKKLIQLHHKRNNKITDYLHKASRKIIQELQENNISELVIGYNKEWKQNINLGSKTNQSFCSIPFTKFIEQLKYKCQLVGIGVLTNEESFTSKCSALDLEILSKKEKYLGTRVKRGLFKTVKNICLNADVNGSLNIGRKVFGDSYVNNYLTNKGYVYHPVKINI